MACFGCKDGVRLIYFAHIWPVHTGSDTRHYTYMFYIKLGTEHRLFYKEQIRILSRVASRVNKPLMKPCIELFDYEKKLYDFNMYQTHSKELRNVVRTIAYTMLLNFHMTIAINVLFGPFLLFFTIQEIEYSLRYTANHFSY